MTATDWVGLSVTGALSLILILLSLYLLSGRGGFFIAGFNTLPKEEKEKYDVPALCRFMGKILLPIGLFHPIVSLDQIFPIPAFVDYIYVALIFFLIIFAIIYTNTGNRFRKP